MNQIRNIGVWESQLSSFTLEDLNLDTFNSFLEKAYKAERISLPFNNLEQILNKLGLAKGNRLLTAGAALFVDSYFNQLEILTSSSNQSFQPDFSEVYTGSNLSLVERGDESIHSILDWKEIDDGFSCKEYPEIPLEAIREALINAFVHREIESMEPVTIHINDNYIYIHNQGQFTGSYSLEAYIQGKGESFRRNPKITRTLFYSKDMEAFATGIRKIAALCKYREIKVEFIEEEDGFTVRFYRHSGPEWSSGH